MRVRRLRLPAALVACLVALPLAAQVPSTKPYEPVIGQLGKDSVWAPTPERLIVRMLQMADTGAADTVIDLGSGDGRVPIVAAKRFGARGIGVEFDADLVRFSEQQAAAQGVAALTRFIREDLFTTDLSQATVVAMYIGPEVTLKLRPKLLSLAPGTRVVTHQFTMGDWEPDEMARVENTPGYLWIVPARIEGRWRVRYGEAETKLDLTQRFQMLAGSAVSGAKTSPLLAARVRGTDVRFTILDANGDSRTFHGVIAADARTMQGRTRSQGPGLAEQAWRAERE